MTNFPPEDEAANSDEDEFFDCEDETPVKKPQTTADRSLPLWERGRRAEGRLRKHLRLRLLEREAEWLYVPLCQEPPPLTEDQLAEQAEVRKTVIKYS